MARNFDGDDANYLSNLAGSPNTGSYPWTIAGWFNWQGTEDSRQYMLTMNYSGSGGNVDTFFNAAFTSEKLGYAEAPSFTPFTITGTANPAFASGEWHHYMATSRSSTDREIYLDGVSDGTDTNDSSGPPSTLDEILIGQNEANSDAADAFLAEWAVWNFAGTADMALELTAGATAFQVHPNTLAGYWPLWGRHATEPDLVGGLDLTVNGTVAAAAHPPNIFMPRPRTIFIPAAVGGGGGRVMSKLAGAGGLAGVGGIAGASGGLAG